MTQLVDVTITAPDVEWLAEHTRRLIEDRLVASGNIIPAVRSIYRWQGEIEEATEAYVVLHTCVAHVRTIIERTNAVHPYETAHILAFDVSVAGEEYRSWVVRETSQ